MCALHLVDREIGTGNVADEQRVAGQHSPRLGTARGVDQRERRVLRPVAGRVERAHADGPELELPAVVEWLMVVVGSRIAMDVDRRARRGGQPSVARDVVGVVVRLEDVLDPNPHVAGEREILLDLELRIDDRGNGRILITDQIRSTAEVVMGDLAKDHRVSGLLTGHRQAGTCPGHDATTNIDRVDPCLRCDPCRA